MKHLDKSSQLFEFEWYLRDLLFRSNDNTSDNFRMLFETKEIVSILNKKYLRYKTWKVDQISSVLASVLPVLQKSGAIIYEPASGIVQLNSKLDRKQCSVCFYINCLGLDEPKFCLRGGSDKLVEFPNSKKL